MNSAIGAYLLLLLALCFYFASPNRPAEKAQEPFPMSEGTYWVYRGVVRWTHDINKVSKTSVEWKMQIRRLIHHGEYSAAVVNGFPTDLDWSDGKPNPEDSLLVTYKGEQFYLLDSQRLPDDLRRLEDAQDSLKGLLDDDDLFLRFPLENGKKFCDAEGMARPDGRYCWVVESSRSTLLDAVIGAPPGKHAVYTVGYRTNPDDMEFDFVPGVGLVSYGYHHHGTVAETEVKLFEFHPASNPHE
jgi:hypothetical protein